MMQKENFFGKTQAEMTGVHYMKEKIQVGEICLFTMQKEKTTKKT